MHFFKKCTKNGLISQAKLTDSRNFDFRKIKILSQNQSLIFILIFLIIFDFLIKKMVSQNQNEEIKKKTSLSVEIKKSDFMGISVLAEPRNLANAQAGFNLLILSVADFCLLRTKK